MVGMEDLYPRMEVDLHVVRMEAGGILEVDLHVNPVFEAWGILQEAGHLDPRMEVEHLNPVFEVWVALQGVVFGALNWR